MSADIRENTVIISATVEIFPTGFELKSTIQNVTKIRPMGAGVFHADG
jgi:hypothetical protein